MAFSIIGTERYEEMVVTKILGNIADYPINDRVVEEVQLEWFELEKKRMRKALASGEEIGICLELDAGDSAASQEGMEHSVSGTHSTLHLHEGDVLYADKMRVIIVAVVPCELTVVEVTTMKEMGRLCFELGNRHLSLSIEEDKVTVPYDEPTFHYLDKMGFCLEKMEGKFSHFTVCHAHGSVHWHE